jgi:hypothetical protein
MATNISKYIQLTDFLLLEYEFNKTDEVTTLTSPHVAEFNGLSDSGTKYFYEGDGALGGTNNILPLNSIPLNSQRTAWYLDSSNYTTTYPYYWDSSVVISTTTYPLDTIKVHIVSGYNFDDIAGFLLQVRAETSTGSMVDLANFTYAKQTQTLGSNVIKFAFNTLFLGNRFYDKYVEFSIPSIQELGDDTVTNLGTTLEVAQLSDIFLTYSTIDEIVNDSFVLKEIVNAQLPVTSVADNFNCHIAESTYGDFIEYYAIWNESIIGNYINDIETGRIRLYTSNNPNDNYEQFTDTYGIDARKWVVIHEISVYEQIPGSSILTQKYSFTQDSDFEDANYFRPILKNSDIAVSYTIQYTCRLTNRMDGTQIIRKASFSSTDPKKYGMRFTRLNVDNLIPYKVFNRIESETVNTKIGNNIEKIKYVKVFYDVTKVVLNVDNEVFPQGTGPLFLKTFDSDYKFTFHRLNSRGDLENVDLSGAYNYGLLFQLDDLTKIEVGPTYNADNMNTTIGEIEFKLTEEQLARIKSQKNNEYSIIIKNPNGTYYTFYQGTYYNYSDQQTVMANYSSLFTVTDLQKNVADLMAEVNRLSAENAELKKT